MHDRQSEFLAAEPAYPQVLHMKSAIKYVRAITRWIGPGFHPDDGVATLVNEETGEPTFSNEDAERIQDQLDTVYEYLDTLGVDPCRIGLAVVRGMITGAFS